jgi:osmotically-inducible protein OsmY
MDASKLQKQVQKQLQFEPRIESSQIGVAANESGVVTLSGTVPSYAQKLDAETAAKRVYGVRGVANDIEIKLPGDIARTDAQIVEAALNGLKASVVVPDHRIKLSSSNGFIRLEGDVDAYFQKQEAERIVRRMSGVMGVTNDIRVKPTISLQANKVRAEIEEALVRSARLDARGITVRTTDSRVVLEGNVRNWAELQEAEDAAWAAPGVADVDNRLVVAP